MENHGITRLPKYVVLNEIVNKELTVIFSDSMKMEMPLYAIYSSGVNISPKVKCFIYFLKENISKRV